jgi:hypothetical protein
MNREKLLEELRDLFSRKNSSKQYPELHIFYLKLMRTGSSKRGDLTFFLFASIVVILYSLFALGILG